MQKQIEQQLYAKLDNNINRKKYRYLLIDNLATVSELDFIHLDNLVQLFGSNAITTLIRPDLSHSPEFCPKLITLAKPHQVPNEEVIDFTLIQATSELNRNKRYICSWIISEHPAEIIVDYFIKISLDMASRCQLPFLPIYEPFRFQLLHEANQVSAYWLPSMLTFCDEYYYLDLGAQLKMIESVKSLPTGIDIFLTETALFYQKHCQHIFQLYLSWQRYCDQVGRSLTSETLMNVARAYYHACDAGLSDNTDQSIFVLMTLRYGDLLSEKIFQQAVNYAVNEPGSLSAEFKLIDKHYFIGLSHKAQE